MSTRALAGAAAVLAAGLLAVGCDGHRGGSSGSACYAAMKHAYQQAASSGKASPAAEPAACRGVPAKKLRSYAGKIIVGSLPGAGASPARSCGAQVSAWRKEFASSGIADDYKQLAQAEAPHPSNVVISGQSGFLEQAAQAVQAIPAPECADPDGYWGQFARALWAGARSDNQDELIGDAVGAVDAFRNLRAELHSEGYEL